MLHHFIVTNLIDAFSDHLEFQVSSAVSFLTPIHLTFLKVTSGIFFCSTDTKSQAHSTSRMNDNYTLFF